MREIEDALRIAERSGDDLAVAFARMTLGVALVHRQRLRSVTADRSSWPRSATSCARDTTWASYRSSRCTWRVRGLGVEIAMAPYRSCAPPSTICSARDSCWRGAFRRPVFWWRHCSIAGPTVTWPKPRPRSSGWPHAPADDGLVIREIWLLRLRALLARAHGDEAAYRDYRDRYRAMATSLGFEGHMAWAEAMP